MTKDKKLVVFDLDGTLSQTHLYSVEVSRLALAAIGRNPEDFTDAQLISCLGKRGVDYTKALMPDISNEDMDKYLHFEFVYAKQCIAANAKCFDGIPQSLQTLKDCGWTIGVCSNAKYEYIDLVLEHLGIVHLIDCKQELLDGLTKVDTLRLLLGRVEHCKAVMVGDTVFDMEAAEKNNIPFVGCLYGYTPDAVRGGAASVESAFSLATVVNTL